MIFSWRIAIAVRRSTLLLSTAISLLRLLITTDAFASSSVEICKACFLVWHIFFSACSSASNSDLCFSSSFALFCISWSCRFISEIMFPDLDSRSCFRQSSFFVRSISSLMIAFRLRNLTFSSRVLS
uniref:Putative secreted protein n=1 Tax=Anopheles marajoara TaxID=58244 RepID=A0A2M4C716_9DIPT